MTPFEWVVLVVAWLTWLGLAVWVCARPKRQTAYMVRLVGLTDAELEEGGRRWAEAVRGAGVSAEDATQRLNDAFRLIRAEDRRNRVEFF